MPVEALRVDWRQLQTRHCSFLNDLIAQLQLIWWLKQHHNLLAKFSQEAARSSVQTITNKLVEAPRVDWHRLATTCRSCSLLRDLIVQRQKKMAGF